MTVNERLFDADQLEAFDAAASARDRERMVRILGKVYVASSTADAILADPHFYGH